MFVITSPRCIGEESATNVMVMKWQNLNNKEEELKVIQRVTRGAAERKEGRKLSDSEWVVD